MTSAESTLPRADDASPPPGSPAGAGGRRRLVIVLSLSVAAVWAAVLGVIVLVNRGGDDDHQMLELVIPAGTGERMDAGEDVVVMPSQLRLEVGDVLRIRNEDERGQSLGPYWIAAGQEFELTYNAPGRFEGYCPLSENKSYDILVTDP